MIYNEKRALALLNVIAGIYMASIAAMLVYPKFIIADGGRTSFVGLFVAVMLLPFLFLSSRIGHHASRMEPGRIMAGGAVTVALSYVAMLLIAPSDPILLALRGLQGIGHVCVISPLFVSAMRVARQTKKAAAIGHLTISIQLGGAAGMTLASLTGGTSDAPRLLVVAAAFAIVAAGLSAVFSVGQAATQAANAPAGTTRTPDLDGKTVVLYIALAVCTGACVQLMASYVHSAALRAASISLDAAYFLTANFVGSALGRLIVGRVNFVPKARRGLAACMAVSVGAMPVVVALASANALLATAGLLMGVLYGVFMPALTVEAITAAPASEQGRVSGRMVMLSELGFRGGPLILALIADGFGYTGMFVLVACLTAVAAAYYFLEPKVKAIPNEI